MLKPQMIVIIMSLTVVRVFWHELHDSVCDA